MQKSSTIKNMTTNATTLTFFDAAQFSKATFTDEGFLKADAVITSAGVYQYKLADGKTINLFRPPAEVFSLSAMQSMRMLPVTNDHPPTNTRLLDAKTAKDFSVGHIGENIVNDNNMHMRASIMITDAATIEQVKDGKRQLSAGYTADVSEESGTFNGKPYTHVQRNIRGNHVAIVKQGRMGAQASIMLDSAVQILNFSDDKRNDKEEDVMSQTLKTVLLDGIEYQAAPEVVNALSKTNAKYEALQNELSQNKTLIDEQSAKIDALQNSCNEYAKRDISAEIKEATNRRFNLLNNIKAIFGDSMFQKVQPLSDHEIKCEVLQPLYKDKDLKQQTEVYIDALFDATIEAKKTNKMAMQRTKLADDKFQTVDNTPKELTGFQKRMSGGIK